MQRRLSEVRPATLADQLLGLAKLHDSALKGRTLYQTAPPARISSSLLLKASPKGVILPPVLAGRSRRPHVEWHCCGVRRSPEQPPRVLLWPRGIGAGYRARTDEVDRM
jgi:hypothetical protein